MIVAPTLTADARSRERHAEARWSRSRRAELVTRSGPAASNVLASFVDAAGSAREVLVLDGAAGCALVIDRRALYGGDERLIAHLAADEPRVNASIACEVYVRHASVRPVRCRAVVAEDFLTPAPGEVGEAEPLASSADADLQVRDRLGRTYHLDPVLNGLLIPELRWRRAPAPSAPDAARTVSVREAIANVEAYEPIGTLTRHGLAEGAARRDLSVAVLRLEFQRLLRSPIVLNRKLRETVLALSAAQDLSMSEIAIRCGRIKRDRGGNISGETSWLARRLGILPEGGREAPTPWIHSDVLALIARRGLGVSPREVEPD
jgi:hypothetical protein